MERTKEGRDVCDRFKTGKERERERERRGGRVEEMRREKRREMREKRERRKKTEKRQATGNRHYGRRNARSREREEQANSDLTSYSIQVTYSSVSSLKNRETSRLLLLFAYEPREGAFL